MFGTGSKHMQFIVKSVSSTVFGIIGGWLGGYVGLGTELLSGLLFSIVGWYWAKHMLNKYLD